MVHVLCLCVSRWAVIRAALAVLVYGVGIGAVSLVWLVTPGLAFQSSTGYARVVNVSAQNALSVAQRSLVANSLGASIASASGPGSVAVRLVASSVGWPALGVLAGLTLLQIVLNGSQVDAIKSGAAGPGEPSPDGVNPLAYPGTKALHQCPGSPDCAPSLNMVEYLTVSQAPRPGQVGCDPTGLGSPPSGWFGWYSSSSGGPGVCLAYRNASGQDLVTLPPQPATATEIADYVQALPAADPNSMESNTTAVGTQATPASATQVSTIPVNAGEVGSSVVPVSQVQSGDAVVNPSAPAPTGTETTQGSQQTSPSTSTTTTTTTTNPDGSTTTTETKTETEEADVSCSAGEHDARTFGSVLQEHITTWNGSGLVGALNLLKNLTWPTALPTYQLQSTILGNFQFDFNAWSNTLTALRSLIIAVASFVAYRIVFVGSK